MFELGLLLQIRKDLLLTDKTIDILNICMVPKTQSKFMFCFDLLALYCNVFNFTKRIS